MALQNSTFGCCLSSSSLDGIHLNNPPPLPTASREETEWLDFDQSLFDLSFNAINAPNPSWPQGSYANSQYTASLIDTTHHVLRSSMNPVQPRVHEAEYLRPITFDTRSTQEQVWGHRSAELIEATPEVCQENASPEIFRCLWEDCQYNGTFGRKTELMRHVETQHVSPKAYQCSFPGCMRKFSRVDNLRAHVRKVHVFRSHQ